MKKKMTALLMVSVMAASLMACGGKSADSSAAAPADSAVSAPASTAAPASETASVPAASEAAEAESDLAYVQQKGKLVVGITDFEPMDYRGEDGDWIGFDADMAKAFGESLGVEVEFVEIDWDNMTLTDEVTSAMECSNPYFNNAQVVILPSDVAEDYESVEDLADLTFAVESGSAGEAVIADLEYDYIPVKAQSDALMEVAAGTSDAAVIDLLMAMAMTGEDTSYEDLTYTIELNSEEYGVGFRKGSDLAAVLDEYFAAAYEDGTMAEIAEEYGIDAEAALIEQ